MAYVTVTIRIPLQVANQAKEAAKISGWELADYLRSLICVGAAFFFLSFGSQASQEAATTLMGGMELLKLSRTFSLHFHERPYAFRIHGRKSTLATLSLPPGCLQFGRYLCQLDEGFTKPSLLQMLATRTVDLPESAGDKPASLAKVGLVLRAGLSWRF